MSTDHDNLMMDYLYDELTPADRAAFEQRMANDPGLKAEVDSFRSTRSLIGRAGEPPEAPVALMQNLLREARLAAAVEPQPSFFESFANLLMRPAFGAVALVLIVGVTGVFISMKADRHEAGPGTAPKAGDATTAQPAMTVADRGPATGSHEGRYREAGETLALEAEPVQPVAESDEDDGRQRDLAAAKELPGADLPEAAPAERPELIEARLAEVAANEETVAPSADPTAAASAAAGPADEGSELEVAVAERDARDNIGAGSDGWGMRRARKKAPDNFWKSPDRQDADGEDATRRNNDDLDDVDGVAIGSLNGRGEAKSKTQAAKPARRPMKVAEAKPRRIPVPRDGPDGAGTKRPAASQVAMGKADMNDGTNRPTGRTVGGQVAKLSQDTPVEKQQAEGKDAPAGPVEGLRVSSVKREADDDLGGDIAIAESTGSARRGKVNRPPASVVYGGRPAGVPAQPKPASQPSTSTASQKGGAPIAATDSLKPAEQAPATRTLDLVGQKRSNGDFERAMDHYRSQRYGNAIRDFERYLKQGTNGHEAEAVHNLARSYQRSNKMRDAIGHYRQLLKRYPKYRYRSAVLVETARLEAQVGNLQGARDLLKAALTDKGQADKARPLLEEIEKRITEQERRRAQRKVKATSKKGGASKAKGAKAKPAAVPKKPTPAKKSSALEADLPAP